MVRKRRLRIYVAGAYDTVDQVKLFQNISRGLRASTELILAGFSPFCSWIDILYKILLKEGETLSRAELFEYVTAWLPVSDAVLVLPESEDSVGTKEEMRLARELGIPVFYTMEDLLAWAKTQ